LVKIINNIPQGDLIICHLIQQIYELMGTVCGRKSSGTMAVILVITFSSLRIFFTDAWYRSKVPWEFP
jgi:hypothetical protein